MTYTPRFTEPMPIPEVWTQPGVPYQVRDKNRSWVHVDCAFRQLGGGEYRLYLPPEPAGEWGPWTTDVPSGDAQSRSQVMPDGTTLYQVFTPEQVVTLYGWAHGDGKVSMYGSPVEGHTHTITGPLVRVRP